LKETKELPGVLDSMPELEMLDSRCESDKLLLDVN
jgi:hypothetical protein